MANMIKCDQGHYYDQTQNSRCPFCGVQSMSIDPTLRHNKGSDASTTSQFAPGKKGGGPNDGDTIAYDATRRSSGAASSDPEATKAIWAQKIGIDPVVGWLVCIQGSNKGRDYRIRSGWNSIGRDPGMQICIAGDETISREDHAKLFFDSKNSQFHIATGSGRSGVYVNGAAVLQPTQLKTYDKVEMGNSVLMFVPFCNEHVGWDSSETPSGS